ncbi:MAG TPA: thiol:disulfide interchange protein DsbA/DsbL [Pseudomonadales bacterium]
MLRIAIATFLSLLLGVQAASAKDYVAGQHYEVLPNPVITRDKNKIEVVELFWYGCSHCFTFEPMLASWKKSLPEDVDFHQMPALWNDTMKLHAKTFYTARALGILDQTHQAFFNAMHVERQRFRNESSIENFFAKYGIDSKTFQGTFNSFGVNSQVSIAESRAASYRMQGTPELVVNGKYRIAGALAGSQADMLKVAEFLINKEREAMAR